MIFNIEGKGTARRTPTLWLFLDCSHLLQSLAPNPQFLLLNPLYIRPRDSYLSAIGEDSSQHAHSALSRDLL